MGRSYRDIGQASSRKTRLSYLPGWSFPAGMVSEVAISTRGRHFLPMFVVFSYLQLLGARFPDSDLFSPSSLQSPYLVTSQHHHSSPSPARVTIRLLDVLSFGNFGSCISLTLSFFRFIPLLSLFCLTLYLGDHLLRADVLPLIFPHTLSPLFGSSVPRLRFIMRAVLVTGVCALSWSTTTYADTLQIGPLILAFQANMSTVQADNPSRAPTHQCHHT